MQQFIGRENWLQRFQDYLHQEPGVIWRITGQPGIGKSTLLRRFEHACETAERPNVWLDMEGFAPVHGLDVLATMAGCARFFDTEKSNKTLKEKVGEGFKTVGDGLVGVLELSKDLIPGGGLLAGGAKVLVNLGAGVAGKAALISETEAAAHPELYLLNALAAAGTAGKQPVCLVDTYEHVLRTDLKIKSRLMLGYGQAREGQEKEMPLSAWLADVFEYLKDKGWRMVVTGRSIPRSELKDNLPRFSRAEILTAAASRPDLREYLANQEDAIAGVLSTLSFEGNPLWLQVAMNLLENLLAEGKDLEQLAQQPEYLQTCFEEDDPFDLGAYDGIEHGRCKLALINTMTRHISGLEDQAWKIALPRVLDRGIVLQLFEPQQARAILHNFTIAGVFRDGGQQFTLHEEIRDLLLAYARSKGWLDTEETRALHGRLWDYLNSFYLGKLPPELRAKVSREGLQGSSEHMHDIEQQLSGHFSLSWMLEACYHGVMSLAELPDKSITPAQFWQAVGGLLRFHP
ncbi:MAG: ATP-binding protein [Thiolinea sp.]